MQTEDAKVSSDNRTLHFKHRTPCSLGHRTGKALAKLLSKNVLTCLYKHNINLVQIIICRCKDILWINDGPIVINKAHENLLSLQHKKWKTCFLLGLVISLFEDFIMLRGKAKESQNHRMPGWKGLKYNLVQLFLAKEWSRQDGPESC